MKTAVITGITGQTGSYLAEILLDKGYKVYGLRRRSSSFNTERIEHILQDPHVDDRLELVYGDLSDALSIVNLVESTKPDLFFNMAGMSHVRVSFECPEYTMDINATGVIRCLEAIRKYSPHTRFVQSSTSELYGSTPAPQNENTLFHPRSPYAVAKIAGYWATVNYREAYGLHASNSISFNHDGERRGCTFVTRKITRAAARIKLGLQDKLYLGNLDAKRDWSHAKDIAMAQYLIATADKPDDFVIGSGESHSVKEFLELVFDKVGLDIGKHVEFDERYLRPSEVDHLEADPTKIRNVLGWKPEYSFENLVDKMIESDLEAANKETIILHHNNYSKYHVKSKDAEVKTTTYESTNDITDDNFFNSLIKQYEPINNYYTVDGYCNPAFVYFVPSGTQKLTLTDSDQNYNIMEKQEDIVGKNHAAFLKAKREYYKELKILNNLYDEFGVPKDNNGKD